MTGLKIRNMALCALFAALLCLCAWLSIPLGDTVLTLQTFGVAFALYLLGGRRGTAAVLVYLLLGAVGLPVFSGFRGGLGSLLGPTGGYLMGFLAWSLVYWLITALQGSWKVPGLILGLIACYGFGTGWYLALYLEGGLWMVFVKCVIPYLLPDAIKLTLAVLLAERLKKAVY